MLAAQKTTLSVELKIIVSKECHVHDCSDPAPSDTIVFEFREALDEAIRAGEVGELTGAIQQSGRRNEIEAIKTAWVGTEVPFVRFTVRVRGSESEPSLVDTSHAGIKIRVPYFSVAIGIALVFSLVR